MRRAHFSIEWMAQSSSQHQAQARPDEEDHRLPAADSVNNQAFTTGLTKASGMNPASLPFTAGLKKASGAHPASLPFTTGLMKASGMNPASLPFTTGLMKATGTHPASLPGSYCRQEEDSHSRKTSPPPQHQNHHDLHSQTASETGFSSGTEEEETSGYESEVSGRCSLSPTAFNNNNADLGSPLSSSSSPTLGRRPRTAFTAEQIGSLERAFKRNAYLGTQDKAELCSKLSLSDKQVRNWFQNRRMKLKRTVQDAMAHACQANMASQLLHYPELQAAAAAYHHQHQQQQRAGPYTPRYHPQEPYHGSSPPAPMTLDSLYHYAAAGLPGVLLTSQMMGSAVQRMGSYQPLPQQY